MKRYVLRGGGRGAARALGELLPYAVVRRAGVVPQVRRVLPGHRRARRHWVRQGQVLHRERAAQRRHGRRLVQDAVRAHHAKGACRVFVGVPDTHGAGHLCPTATAAPSRPPGGP